MTKPQTKNPERVAWFHCFSGVAGNMALGSLIDAGANVDEITEIVSKLGISPFVIEATPVLRGGITATYVDVKVVDDAHHRDYATIVALIDAADLPPRVKERSLNTFRVLGEAEASMHGTTLEEIHFHEVGSMDAIVDIVGTCAALELLGIDQVRCSPIANGVGTIKAAHGEIPNPPPAVTRILTGVPVVGKDIAKELTTPTGAALMVALAESFGAMPSMTITTSGFGGGTSEIPNSPNATQVIVGTLANERDNAGQTVSIVEVTLDDVSGEIVAHTIARCLDNGAHDAWVTPIIMKKGRPGYILSAICDIAAMETIRTIITQETGSFGSRSTSWSKWSDAREFSTITLDGCEIRIKTSDNRSKVEFDDAAKAAQKLGLPVREVIRRAEEIFHSSNQ